MFSLRKELDFAVPEHAKLVLHLIIKELLLTSLSSEDFFHVKSALTHDLIKQADFFLVDLFLEMLNLLYAINLYLLFLVDIFLS